MGLRIWAESSNIIAILGLLGVTLQMFFIGGVVKGYETSYFIDTYLLKITSILNGFIRFLILLVVVFVCESRGAWPVTAMTVHELTENQDLALVVNVVLVVVNVNPAAVRDDGDHVALVSVLVGEMRVIFDS